MYRSMKEFKKDWTAALRSGEYRKGKGNLCKEGRKADSFCCLGVAADLLILAGHKCSWGDKDCDGALSFRSEWDRPQSGLLLGNAPPFLKKWLDVRVSDACSRREAELASLNDNGASFKKLADVIEGWE